MDEFILPHFDNVEVVDNTQRCVLLQRELTKAKRIKQQTHAWYKKAVTTVRDVAQICEALHEVLELSGETRADQLPSDSDSDSESDDECAQAEQQPIPLPSDTVTMQKQIEKIHKFQDATKVKLREISELAVHHRREIVHYTKDDSHNFLQQMAIEAHSHSHAAIMVALHCGMPGKGGSKGGSKGQPGKGGSKGGSKGKDKNTNVSTASVAEGNDSTCTSPKTGMTILESLRESLQQIVSSTDGSVPHLVMAKAIEAITKTEDIILHPDPGTWYRTIPFQAYSAKLFLVMRKWKESWEKCRAALVHFDRIEGPFAKGLVEITGVRPPHTDASGRDRIERSIGLLEEFIVKISNFVVQPAPLDSSYQTDLVGILETELEANDASKIDELYTMLAEQSYVIAGVNRVFSDICIRYPHLNQKGITPVVLMDRQRNALHACFQRLVGVDCNMSRRMSGVKVTYASDYDRMANQYRTTMFAFKNATIHDIAQRGICLTLPGVTFPSTFSVRK